MENEKRKFVVLSRIDDYLYTAKSDMACLYLIKKLLNSSQCYTIVNDKVYRCSVNVNSNMQFSVRVNTPFFVYHLQLTSEELHIFFDFDDAQDYLRTHVLKSQVKTDELPDTNKVNHLSSTYYFLQNGQDSVIVSSANGKYYINSEEVTESVFNDAILALNDTAVSNVDKITRVNTIFNDSKKVIESTTDDAQDTISRMKEYAAEYAALKEKYKDILDKD